MAASPDPRAMPARPASAFPAFRTGYIDGLLDQPDSAYPTAVIRPHASAYQAGHAAGVAARELPATPSRIRAAARTRAWRAWLHGGD